MSIRQALAIGAASGALIAFAQPAKSQEIPATPPSVNIPNANGGNANSNATAGNININTNNTVTICKDKVTGEFSRWACSEKQVAFFGDRTTRRLTIEQIGYIALGHVREAEGNAERGIISSEDAEMIADHSRNEFQRIAKSRKVEAPEWQIRHMFVHIASTPAERMEQFQKQYCDPANQYSACAGSISDASSTATGSPQGGTNNVVILKGPELNDGPQ